MKCYNCGGEVLIGEGSHIGICSCCMAEIPLPKGQGANLDAYSQANLLLSESRFEEAREAFREILIQSPLEAAACWGIAVSEYGIEFVQDPATGELLPTLHRLAVQKFSEYLYVTKAIQCAPDPDTKAFYQTQSQRIDEIQSHSLQISQKEDPYDIFICYKKTEEGEKRTADSRMAADLYRELKGRGYKVFFAEETLHVGEEYEPRIFAALHSARVLLAIASKPQYYEAVWVKNEWSRYADLIRTEQAAGGTERILIPVHQNMTLEEMPETLRQMPQQVDMTRSVNPRQELLRLVGSHFDKSRKEDVSGLRRQLKTTGKATSQMDETAANFLTRATIQLSGGAFAAAKELFEKSLKIEESAETYLGLCMCDLQVPGKEALYQYVKDIRDNPYFCKARNLAEGELAEEYDRMAAACLKNEEWERTCQEKRRECAEKVKTLNRIAKADMNRGPIHKEFSGIYSFAQRAEKLDKEGVEFNWRVAFWCFLLIGNVLPGLLFTLANHGTEMENAGLGIMMLMGRVPGFFLMWGGYAVFFTAGFADLVFHYGGLFTKIISFALSQAAFFFSYSFAFFEETVEFFIVATVLFVIYHLLIGHRAVSRRSQIRKLKKTAVKYLKRLEEKDPQGERGVLESGLIRETMLAVEKTAEEYRAYFWKEELWTRAMSGWKQSVENQVKEDISYAKDILRTTKRGGSK